MLSGNTSWSLEQRRCPGEKFRRHSPDPREKFRLASPRADMRSWNWTPPPLQSPGPLATHAPPPVHVMLECDSSRRERQQPLARLAFLSQCVFARQAYLKRSWGILVTGERTNQNEIKISVRSACCVKHDYMIRIFYVNGTLR